MSRTIRITVWNEYRHEKNEAAVAAVYPAGIHEAVAEPLRRQPGFTVRTATLDEPAHGLGGGVLESTDVLIWWGHQAHEEVSDAVTARVQQRVLQGMGLVVLHSGHLSKPFTRLMGTSCLLRWREAGEKERLWVVEHGHPIADGLGPWFEIPHEEMYGERFDVPAPESVVFISWFAGGNVFRSGCCWTRGKGRIFYFRPGHETHPTYAQREVQTVIRNAVLWTAPGSGPEMKLGDREPPLETI